MISRYHALHSDLCTWLAVLWMVGVSAVPCSAAEPFPVKVDPAQDEFTLIVLPDTQRYALYFPEIFLRQTEWIREHHQALNTRFVVHLGDVVEEGGHEEWAVADRAFRMLDGIVPYLVVPGNHDYSKGPDGKLVRQNAAYNAVFSPYRFQGRPWYGGHKGVTSDNSFGYFEAAGQKFMVLGLEHGPSDETLAWALGLASNHEDGHKIIVVTHCYMYDDDTRVGDGDRWNPKDKASGSSAWNDGEGIWEKFVSRANNVCMVLSGHVKGDGTGLLISRGRAGNMIVQMLSNYQFLTHGGEGWLRILKFRPRQGRLEVYTYSPWLARFREEADQRMDIDVPWLFEAAVPKDKPKATGN